MIKIEIRDSETALVVAAILQRAIQEYDAPAKLSSRLELIKVLESTGTHSEVMARLVNDVRGDIVTETYKFRKGIQSKKVWSSTALDWVDPKPDTSKLYSPVEVDMEKRVYALEQQMDALLNWHNFSQKNVETWSGWNKPKEITKKRTY